MEVSSIMESSREINKKIIENSMSNILAILKHLETPACRNVLSKESIENRRRNATLKFKNLIIALDSMNQK
jgi:hypothetical protein